MIERIKFGLFVVCFIIVPFGTSVFAISAAISLFVLDEEYAGVILLNMACLCAVIFLGYFIVVFCVIDSIFDAIKRKRIKEATSKKEVEK